MIQTQIDQLLLYAAERAGRTTPPISEIVQAKQEYFAQTGGEVHEEDRCYELRMQAFFNWYLLDRKLADGSTIVENYLREKGPELAGPDKDVLVGCTQSRLSLYEYRGNGWIFSRPVPGAVRIRDVLSGDDFDVTERRAMHGLDWGDLFEARLVPVGRAHHFSTSFTYHPREARSTILREVKKRKKQGNLEARALLFELERMALQHERFRNVTLSAIYNFETPFLSRRKAGAA